MKEDNSFIDDLNKHATVGDLGSPGRLVSCNHSKHVSCNQCNPDDLDASSYHLGASFEQWRAKLLKQCKKTLIKQAKDSLNKKFRDSVTDELRMELNEVLLAFR